VTDAQRAALADRIRLSRYLRLPLAVPLAAVIFLLPHFIPGTTLVGTAMTALIVYVMVAHFVEYLMIRSLIAGLPLGAERMTLIGMHQQQSKTMSLRAQAALCIFFGLICAGSLACLPFGTPDDRQMIIYVACLSGGFFIIWISMLIAKLLGR
jgi:hypothetical protein